MTQRVIDLLLWVGAVGVPGALVFAVFISTLGPDKQAERASDQR